MAVGRYPLKSAWAFRAKTARNTFAPLRRYGRRSDSPIPFLNWFLGDDGITPQTTPYDSGLAVLKRWNGVMWIAAALKVKKF